VVGALLRYPSTHAPVKEVLVRTLILFALALLFVACAGVGVPACGGGATLGGVTLRPGAELTLQAETPYGVFTAVGQTCDADAACDVRICFLAYGQEVCLERPRPSQPSSEADVTEEDSTEESVAEASDEEDAETEEEEDSAEESPDAPESEGSGEPEEV